LTFSTRAFDGGNGTALCVANSCLYHVATSTTSPTAREFFPNPEFSLANHVFGAVWQRLREGHEQLLEKRNEELHQEQPAFLVLASRR
jgi:hypothetical protein